MFKPYFFILIIYMSNVKVIKINEPNNEYDNILSSTKKIKDILEAKRKTRVNKETRNKVKTQVNNESPKTKPQQKTMKVKEVIEKSQPQPKPKQNKFLYKTKKKTNLRKKKMTSKEINSQFKKIVNKGINTTNKENLLNIFQKVLLENNTVLTNKFIKLINKKQLTLILSFLDLVTLNTHAPTPLLKNILYNYLTSTIKIIK